MSTAGTGIGLLLLFLLMYGLGKKPDQNGQETPPEDGGEIPPGNGGETPPEDGGETSPEPGTKILELKKFDVISINDIPFVETGYGPVEIPCSSCNGEGGWNVFVYPTGYVWVQCTKCGGTGKQSVTAYYARLQTKIVQPDLFVKLRILNKSVRLSDENYRDLGAHAFYQISGGPSFSSRAGIQLYYDAQGYPYRNPPFEFTVTPQSVIGAGSWKPKLYSAEFRIFAQYYEADIGTAVMDRFYVLDFLECVGSGQVTV